MSDDFIEPPAVGQAPPRIGPPRPTPTAAAPAATASGFVPIDMPAKPQVTASGFTPVDTPQQQEPGPLQLAWRGLLGAAGVGEKQADAAGSAIGDAWGRLVKGNLLGLPGPSALERSAEISGQGPGWTPQRPYRPGMTMGEMLPKDWQSNPMLGALGAGNIGMRAAPSAPAAAAAARLKDFADQGVTPSVPSVGQGRVAGLAANLGRLVPFSPVSRGITRNIEQTSQAADRAAAGYGRAAGEVSEIPSTTGATAQNAFRRFASDKSQANREFGEFFGLMRGAPPIQVSRTVGLLQDLMGKYPNVPELTGLFSSPKLGRMARALEPRTETIPAQTSQMLDQFGRPAVTQPAQTVQRGGVLSIPELRELRSGIGRMLEKPSFGPEDIPRGELKRLYAALTQDMQESARLRGPRAVSALNKATINYGTRMRLIDRLSDMTSATAPETVFAQLNRAAGTTTGADAGLLRAAQKAMTSEEWGDLGASIIRRLGNPNAGQPRGEISFSPGTFATNWRKLSGPAKDLLFGSDSPSSPRSGLEQLARVTNDIQRVSKLGNAPHSGEYVVLGGILTEGLREVMSGQIPWKTAATTAGAWGASKALMSPGFARWMYRLPNTVARAPSEAAAYTAALADLRASLGGKKEKEEKQPAAPPTAPAPRQPPLEYPWAPAAR